MTLPRRMATADAVKVYAELLACLGDPGAARHETERFGFELPPEPELNAALGALVKRKRRRGRPTTHDGPAWQIAVVAVYLENVGYLPERAIREAEGFLDRLASRSVVKKYMEMHRRQAGKWCFRNFAMYAMIQAGRGSAQLTRLLECGRGK